MAITTTAIAKTTGQILFDGCFWLTARTMRLFARAASCSMV
jgi:hypothetical protein